MKSKKIKNALVLFTKEPVVGKVKTRLLSELSPSDACRLYRAFVEDLVESFCGLHETTLFLSCSPSTAHPFLESLSQKYSLNLINQSGKHLGERMENTLQDLWEEGFSHRVIIGTDSPTLSIDLIQEAFHQLKDHSLTFGPSNDGGYYLVGVSGPSPSIFSNISWSTDQVMTQTLEKIHLLRISTHLLSFWYDVDTPKDLRFLHAHLNYLNIKGSPIPKRTYEEINRLFKPCS